MSIESRSVNYGRAFGNWNVGSLLNRDPDGNWAMFQLSRDRDGRQEYNTMWVISVATETSRKEALPRVQWDEYAATVRARCAQAEQELRWARKVRGTTGIVEVLDSTFQEWNGEDGFGTDLVIRTEQLPDLGSQMKAQKRFTEREIIRIGQDICQALAVFHEQGGIHRSVRPEQIFVAPGGCKLGCFGSLLTRRNDRAYIAPEQAHGQFDRRTDIFGLGLVLYVLCSGNRIPTEREIRQRLSGVPLTPPPTQDPRLARVILKACAPRLEDRYQNAREFLADLRALEKPAVAAAGNTVQKPEEKKKKTGLLTGIIVGAVAMVALAAAVVLLLPGKTHEHVWEKSTCTAPRTCRECGQTTGEAKGHDWAAPTCTSPSTCRTCGQTDGEPLAHDWSAATCAAPSTCRTCGQTDGKPLDHNWFAATYEAPKTCGVCGATEGEPLVRTWVYLNELSYSSHDGKVWTMSEQAPDFYADSGITDEAAYKDENVPGHVTGQVRDYLGNAYTYGICVDGLDYREYSITYTLSGGYDTFSGYISMTPDVQWDSAAGKGKYFEVYGDGVLLYRSPAMTNTLPAQTFAVDISGVNRLTIRYPQTSGPSRMATIFDGKLS